MKDKIETKVRKKGIAVAISVALTTGCFLIFNMQNSLSQTSKVMQFQSLNEKRIDAMDGIMFKVDLDNDTVVKPQIRMPNNVTSTHLTNKTHSTIKGNNNIIIQGNNNTVVKDSYNTINKYGEISIPQIYDVNVKYLEGKYKCSSLNHIEYNDSLFLTVVTFKYLYKLKANQLLIGLRNAIDVKDIIFRYADRGAYLLNESFNFNRKYPYIIIKDPLNGNMVIMIYSSVRYAEVDNMLDFFVDSVEFKAK